jgi:glycosyltransferase involved in cell wall biosynthesis
MQPKKDKIKLAILISHPIHYQVPLFQKLSQHPDIDLTVYFCSDEGVTEKYRKDLGGYYKWDIPLLEGYRYKFLGNWSPISSTNRFWGLFNPGIIRKLWSERYDAILIHGYSHATNLLAYTAARLRGTQVLLRGETVLRQDRPWYIKAVKALLLKVLAAWTSAFLTIGSRSKEFYQYYGISLEKMFFTPYCVNNEYFIEGCRKERWRRDALKHELGIPKELPVILYCGKLIDKKRPGDLLEALGRVRGRAALVFVGDGPLRPVLEQIGNDRPYVKFVGFRNQSELPRFYALADIFVLPSSSQEVSPLVINEAMCGGLPVIVSNAVPSAVDFVRDGENGFIYPVGKVEALADHLDDLLADPGRREKMGLRSLEIIENWNYDLCMEGLLKALESLRYKTEIVK